MPQLLTTAEVAAQLRVCEKTIERVMLEAVRVMQIRPAWAKIGRSARWYPDEVRRFFDEVTAWRSKREATASASAGAASTAGVAERSAPAGAPPRRSSTRSRKPTTPVASTIPNLVHLLKSLP